MGARATAFTGTRLVNDKALTDDFARSERRWPGMKTKQNLMGTTALSIDEPTERHVVKRVAEV